MSVTSWFKWNFLLTDEEVEADPPDLPWHILLLFYVYVFYLHICLCTICMPGPTEFRRWINHLELQLPTAVSCQLDAEDSIWVH